MTTERCPACRSRLSQEPTCPRCGCDLSLVRCAEAQARQLLTCGVRAWARGDRRAAAAFARASLALDHTPLAAAVLTLSEAAGPFTTLSWRRGAESNHPS